MMLARSKRFVAAAVIAAVLLATYMAWTGFKIGGDAITVGVIDYGEAAAAFIGALSCLVAARRASGYRSRWGWSLFGLSALSWGVGETIWAVNEVNLGTPVPFPSPADVGFVTAIPLAAGAIIAFPFGATTHIGRMHEVLDGLSIATALTFIAWCFGLGSLEAQARTGELGGVLAIAYPGGDILLLTLLAMSVRRAPVGYRVVLGLLSAAYIATLVADASSAYLLLDNTYGVLGSMYDSGWVAGYLLLALAAVWPAPKSESESRLDAVEMWQLAMPWIAVLGVLAASVFVARAGRQVGSVATWLGAAVGVMFLSSQAVTFYDTLRLLVRSRRAEAQLEERTSLLGEIIGRAPLGIARLTKEARFMDANPGLAAMLGVPAQALIGSSIDQFLIESDPDRARRVELMITRQIDHAEVDSAMRCGDGRTIWVHRRVTPVFTAGGQLAYFLVLFEDTTAKHEVEEAQRANLGELERINRLKSEFMSMVSHEFRTALTGIQGYSEVLNTEEVAPNEVRDFAGDINSEALRLNRMISEMLDLDRIESGRLQLHVEPVDLNKLVAGAVERAQMTSQRHTIALHLDPNITRVDGDADRLTQVVGNLLSNAIKYSPNGGDIDVTTSLLDGNVEVGVRDHGQGIPPEFLKRIFGRYERYEGAAKSQVVGTGLGLAIAQQIVQLHKGRIWVESEVGEGSEFRFVIPASATSSQVA